NTARHHEPSQDEGHSVYSGIFLKKDMSLKFSPIPEVLADLKKGKLIIVVDDADRENKGDLIVAAEHATPTHINFMAKHGRGIICVPMESRRLAELGVDLMVSDNTDEFKT